MRSNFLLLVGLSAVFVFLSIYGTSYVNGQTSANHSSAENGTSSASSVLQTDNLDPFKSKTSSNSNPSEAAADTSANGNNDDTSIANDDSSNSNNDDTSIANDDSANDNSNNDDSSNSNSDDGDKDDSADDNSSDEDKESKDDRKFELPFP